VNYRRSLDITHTRITAGSCATLGLNWQIDERVILIATYGARLGFCYTVIHSLVEQEKPDTNVRPIKNDSKNSLWNLLARIQTVSLGFVFYL
jgi:hypothetical protein